MTHAIDDYNNQVLQQTHQEAESKRESRINHLKIDFSSVEMNVKLNALDLPTLEELISKIEPTVPPEGSDFYDELQDLSSFLSKEDKSIGTILEVQIGHIRQRAAFHDLEEKTFVNKVNEMLEKYAAHYPNG